MQSSIVQALASGTQSYGTRIRYDTYYGRPVGQEYPNGESVQVLYSSYGDAIAEKEPVSGVEYRRSTGVNARGQATQEVFGNGVTLTPTYQLQTGQLTGLTYSGMAGTLRQLGYGYDVFGNLKRQSLGGGASREDYSYDQLHRLVQSIRSGAASGTVNYGFDAVGNLTKKSDFSSNTTNAYGYTGGSCGGGANAVKSVQLNAGGTRTYCYDANGNLTGDNAGLSLKYDHQNLPVVAQRGALRDDFRYGTDGMRTRSWGSDGARVYLPGYEHRTDTGETKVYIGDYAVISRTGSTRKVEYLLKDRLGSVDAVANSSGVVTETRGYDAFGKPRSGTWNDLSPAKIGSTAVTPKGFTQHEHLNELELIHMNGRMYDYNVGRFMGVDPFIQFPLNSQSLNPYSYILNNPLSGTDPSGYATCSADSNAADCAEAAGSGGEAKVYQQNEGSRIKQTVGTVKNNGDGSATFTNNAGDSKTIGGKNGSPSGQGTMGASSRQDQAAQGSSKGTASNSSASNGQGGNGSNPADRFLPESMRGVRVGASGDDELPLPKFTMTMPDGLKDLMQKFPEIGERMDAAWNKSFGWFFRNENGLLGFQSPDGAEMKFVEYSAYWRYSPGAWGYKGASISYDALLAAMKMNGIPQSWKIMISYHTHPFDKCFSAFGCVFNSDAGPYKGPSGQDGKMARTLPGVYHVVRAIKGNVFDSKSKAHEDYFYGATAVGR